MTAQAHTPFDGIREIDPNLKKLDAIPLTGGAPPFPWEELSAHLAKSFEKEEFSIKPGETAWRSKETLYEGLGDEPYPLIFTVPSLRGQVCWVMPTQELDVLTALLLTKESHPLTFHDADLTQSFYRFLALEVLYTIAQLSYDKTLSPVLTNQTTLPHQDSLCKDISIALREQTIWGRLIISPEFRSSWAEHFAQKEAPSELSQQLSQLATAIVHIEAGKSELTLNEWRSIKEGDFLLLDSCSLDPATFTGRVMLTIDGRRAFRAKLKDGTLKILELPLLQEVVAPMAKQPESEHEEEEHDEEDELSDLDLPEEEEETEDSDLFEEDLLSEKDVVSEEQIAEEAVAAQEEEPTTAAATEEKGPQAMGMITPEQIPLNVVVEMGQIQMTVEQLMKLEPGNMLEIDIHPENGVNLTIHGKVVGKGQLIRIGEAIGVRVVQLG